MQGFSIRTKLVLSVFIAMVVGAALIALVLQKAHSDSVGEDAKAAIVSADTAFAAIQRAHTERLYALLDALSSDPGVTDAFSARDRTKLSALTMQRFSLLKKRQSLSRWYFYTPEDEATVFLRAYKGKDALLPENFGDKADRATYFQAVKTKGPVSGFELGATALALRAAQPHYDTKGHLIGYMAVGEEIDDFLSEVAAQTGDDYAFLLDKSHLDADEWALVRRTAGLANNWEDSTQTVLADATIDEPELLATKVALQDLPDGGALLGEKVVDGRTIAIGAFPVYEAGGEKAGAVMVFKDLTGSIAAGRKTQIAVLATVAALMMLVAITILVSTNELIFKRLVRFIARFDDLTLRISGGDFAVPASPSERMDEIGEFDRSLTKFLTMMATVLRQFSEEPDSKSH